MEAWRKPGGGWIAGWLTRFGLVNKIRALLGVNAPRCYFWCFKGSLTWSTRTTDRAGLTPFSGVTGLAIYDRITP